MTAETDAETIAILKAGFIAALGWTYDDTAALVRAPAMPKDYQYSDRFVVDIAAMRAAYQLIKKDAL